MVLVLQKDLNKESSSLLTNAITYLNRVSTLPEMNNPTLKSFISLKTKLMSFKLNEPINVNYPTSLHCQRCFLSIRDGPTKYKVKPKNKNHRFAKKMFIKQNTGLSLTKYQEEYLRRNRIFNGNYLEVTCGFCKNKTTKKMQFPANFRSNLRQKDLSINVKKPKKKKGDKLCGLNEEAVLSVEPKKRRKRGRKSGLNESSVICLDTDDNETPKKKPNLCFNNNNDESVILLENTSNIEQLGQVEQQKNEENNPPSNNNSITCPDSSTSDQHKQSNKSHRIQRAEKRFIDQRNCWSPEFETSNSNQKYKVTKKKRPRQSLDSSTPIESTPKSNSAIKKQKTSNLKLSKLLNEGANKKKSSSNLLQFLESL